MSNSVETGWGTLLLLAARLDYVDYTEGREGSFHEVIEPGLGYLPVTLVSNPDGRGTSVVPERVFGEWWKNDAELTIARDYFRVEDTSGERFWLYRAGDGEHGETGSQGWFLHGIFG